MTSPTLRVLFLAHARADIELVPQVARAAHSAGLRLWSESADLPTAEPIRTTLTQVIQGCAVFAVLVTSRSVRRSWVRWELEYAYSIGKTPILPIIGEPGVLPTPPFDRFHQESYLPLRPVKALASRLAALTRSLPPIDTDQSLPSSTTKATPDIGGMAT